MTSSLLRRRTSRAATWRDYKELTKPNVVLLMILTSVIGMFMAVPGMVPLNALILGNLGIALCAGAAAPSITWSTSVSTSRWLAPAIDRWRRAG